MNNNSLKEYFDTNRKLWNGLVSINKRSKMYDLDGFRKGKSSLNFIELEELGDVRGKSLLHLQCHFGMDTLSWAKQGAKVTGIDFSEEAIQLARSLSEDLDIPAEITGSGGGNDIASSANRVVIIIRHEKRKLNKAVSFITSPGYLGGNGEREKHGLRGGPSRVITDKAIFGFDSESKPMRLESIHPTTTPDEVLANMSFDPIVPNDLPVTEPPTAEQVRLIREEIDPEGKYAR